MTNGVSSIFVSYEILKEKQKLYFGLQFPIILSFIYFFLIYLIFNVKTAHKVKKKTNNN